MAWRSGGKGGMGQRGRGQATRKRRCPRDGPELHRSPLPAPIAARPMDFIASLQALGGRYGSKPGVSTKPVLVVLDNGPIHASKAICSRSL